MMQPDLLIYGGVIHTLDPALPRVDALVVRGSRILASGSESDMRGLLRSGYEVLDLKGGAAVPGLCDAHVHLLGHALARQNLLLDGADFPTVLQLIAARAETLAPGEWLIGRGWDQSLWGGRWPTAAELDAVIGDRPALLTRKDGHSLWASSAALRLAGIDERTADPAGGEIQRDEHGRPTGILLENAMELARRHAPEPNAERRQRALLAALDEARRYGLTSLHCPEPADCFSDLQELYRRGELGARILFHLPLNRLEEALALGVRSGLGDEWLRIGGVKIFSDGALGSCTCHMLEPFEGTDNRGIPTLSREELFDVVDRAIGGGISIAAHAIGDAANRNVLEAIAAALSHHGEAFGNSGIFPYAPTIPNRIEHAQIVDPSDVRRFAALGVVASMQPIHATADIEIADRFWGARSAHAYAWRALHDAGAILAFGSDAPIETMNPWAGIHAAVTRQRPDGTPPGGWYAAQRLELEEALWAYTVGPAIASGELELKGTLEPGKLADIAVLPVDPFSIDPSDLFRLQPSATIVGGQLVAFEEP